MTDRASRQRGNPVLARVGGPGPRDHLSAPKLRDRMAELGELAEGHGETATRANFKAARILQTALARAGGYHLGRLDGRPRLVPGPPTMG